MTEQKPKLFDDHERSELIKMIADRLRETIPEGASSDVQRLAAAYASLWGLSCKF